jgi:hypothetical protein
MFLIEQLPMTDIQRMRFGSGKLTVTIAMVVTIVAISSILIVPAVSATAPATPSAPRTYHVQISEIGLPTGTAWYVDISSSTAAAGTFTSTSSSIVVTLPNGTYIIRAGTDNLRWTSPATLTIKVKGAPLAVAVKFDHRSVFSVTFNEKGLPAGASWRVDVTGANIPATSISSTAAAISIALPNGSFTFQVGTSAKAYHADPGSGTLHVAGAIISIGVKFEKGTVSG